MLRDRFFTPQTAKAIMSWRILLAIAVAAVAALLGLPLVAAIVLGLVVFAVAVGLAMPKPARAATIDPFAVGEPWRQLVQGSQAAGRKLQAIVEGVSPGPLRLQLDTIAAQLRHGLDEAWRVARGGDEIDDAVRRLDPVALRSKRASLQAHASIHPSDDAEAAVASVEAQLELADRLKQQSAEAAATLRLTQTQLDELVARAAEVSVGSTDTGEYARQVDDLVLQLEALRRAVDETRTS